MVLIEVKEAKEAERPKEVIIEAKEMNAPIAKNAQIVMMTITNLVEEEAAAVAIDQDPDPDLDQKSDDTSMLTVDRLQNETFIDFNILTSFYSKGDRAQRIVDQKKIAVAERGIAAETTTEEINVIMTEDIAKPN